MIAIDTSVWVEYINTGGVFHPQAKAVIDSLGKGGTEAILIGHRLRKLINP